MDDPIIPAVCRALALFARLIERGGGEGHEECAALLAVLAALAAEHDPRQGDILSAWAAMVADGQGGRLADRP